jgi:predicted nucleotidyltransferase
MPNEAHLLIAQDRLAAFCRENHIKRLALFGSAQRGELRADSDIDLLVEFQEGHVPSLFGIVRMQMALSAMLGREVDLRTAEDLSRYFRGEVVRTAEVQYEA